MIVDAFGRVHDYLRISLTEKCCMRCSYCMPEDGLQLGDPEKIMKCDEVIKIASIFISEGVNRIRLTGGEPLVCRDFTTIVEQLSKMPVRLAITTNGVLVHRFIDVFKVVGLQDINISCDSLNEERFNSITRRHYFKQVINNIHLLLAEGFNVKINAVASHLLADEDIFNFIDWTKELPLHVRFIEFMPFNGNQWQFNAVVPYQTILQKVKEHHSIEKLNDNPHSTSKSYKVPGYQGSFAFISTVTEPFCDTCNRMRLTSDGKLRNCLFAKEETDLLVPFRNGENIVNYIHKAIGNKKEARGGLHEFNSGEQLTGNLSERTMTSIGG